PFRQAEFDILYAEGISFRGELVDLGVIHKLVTKSGAWYAYGEVRLGPGRENAMAFLKDNPDLQQELEARLREAMGLRPVATQPVAVPRAAGE
ncbi:MAG TPA: DNA recombination/repair protein RecA, partial [Thermoanaerobaculia bacterium]|nr:DNA recombination/repair protein RecA [Thermoanaerobaculia bacterium]